ADKNDAAVKELGFQEAQTAAGPFIGSNLDNFVLETSDALFKLNINNVSYDVTVTKASTVGNITIANLATDVNLALANAKISGTATAANLSSKVVAEGSGSALVLRIIDPAIAAVGLSAAIDNPAVFDLGL